MLDPIWTILGLDFGPCLHSIYVMAKLIILGRVSQRLLSFIETLSFSKTLTFIETLSGIKTLSGMHKDLT